MINCARASLLRSSISMWPLPVIPSLKRGSELIIDTSEVPKPETVDSEL